MAAKKPAKKGTASKKFTAEEMAAMRERAKELKAGKVDGETDALTKIAELAQPERAMAERLHALIKASAPGITAKTWYGMPAYAKDGNTICFFQSAGKFKTRYATLGFSDKARLDDGVMWPNAYALMQLGPAEEERITALVKKAVG